MQNALVLNSSFEPILVVTWQKAMVLLLQGKVEVLEESDRVIRTVSKSFRLPSVLRLIRYAPLHKRKVCVRFSRENVLQRDLFCCQYCGRKRSLFELTLDHVIPAARGGKKTWENIVTACFPCNQKKSNRTPSEAGMSLIRLPQNPKWLPETEFYRNLKSTPEQWKLYLSWSEQNSI